MSVGVLVAPTTSVVVVTTVRITSVVVGVLVPSLSLSNTVRVVVVVLVPLVTVYVSGLATIGVLPTFTVAVAVAQLLGFKRSQMLYTIS